MRPQIAYMRSPEVHMKVITEMVCGYGALLESFGYRILVKVDQDDCPGDSWVLFQNGQGYGYLVFGWGSCSGCDAFQGCGSVEELVELRDGLHGRIHWEESAAAMLTYFEGKDFEVEFYGLREEFQDFLAQAEILLMGTV